MHTVELKFKICTKCGEKKPATTGYFAKQYNGVYGLHSQCKLCNKAYRLVKKQYLKQINHQWYLKNHLHVKGNALNWRNKNYIRYEAYKKQWRQDNLDKCRQYSRTWKSNNKVQDRLSSKRYQQKRCTRDPFYKFKQRCRIFIVKSINRGSYYKNQSTIDILGCNFEFFLYHLTLTFIENYSRLPDSDDEIHVDHIVPLSSVISEDEVIKLNHYSNLQWLLKEDNLRKSNQIDFKLFE